jgi:hypothetical protein
MSTPDDKLSADELRDRRRRLAEVFGDVLPEQTSDDLAEEAPDKVGSDAWLRAQVPPHHGS